MGLQPKTTEESILRHNAWQLSDHGQGSCPTGTLDLTQFEGHEAGGFIADGTPVVRDADTGLYGPSITFDAAAAEPAYVQGDVDGHVYKPVHFDAGQTRAGFARFWHGRVKASAVPVPTGQPGATFDPSTGADHIEYV